MIEFLTLEIEGFGSIQTPVKVKFNKKGLVLVKGDNGVGKTTIFSALGWVAYGTGLKKNASILTWEHKRFGDYAGCMVKLKLRKDGERYDIIRCKDYTKKIEGVQGKNRVLIYKDGELLPDAKLKQANPYIQKLLGMSFELFKTSIIFGQKMKRLIEEDGPTKKRILEEICEISYIEKAKTIAEKNLTDARKELNSVNTEMAELEASIEAKETELDRLYNLEKTWRDTRTQKVNEQLDKAQEFLDKIATKDYKKLRKALVKVANEISGFKNLIEEYKAKTLELKTIQTAYDKAVSRKATLKEANDKIQLKLDTLEETLKDGESGTCPECGQGMSDKISQSLLHEYTTDIATNCNAIEILNKAILGHKNKLASMQKDGAQADATAEALQTALDKRRSIEADINQVDDWVKRAEEYRDSADKLLNEVPEFNIEKVKTEIEVLKEELEPIEDLQIKWSKKVKIYSWAITVPLSNSGLKSFIFNQMIQKVNHRLTAYASRIGFLPKMVVDLQSARKDINMVVYAGKYPIPYEDLSGGQSQLVNIAIAFAVHDVVAEDVFNLLVLDEVFESLSAENVELVAAMVAEKSHKKAIYLITHLKDFFPETQQVLEITIPSGVTEVIQA